ncbi:uncharacterized protein LOC110722707 [Chenopodium quinoa]|uniref:uncharacterized protein LOC110722707 n=1 Tax=Chenopodium quinoa TaxID=63459 RepID=UPI000B78D014|nr:uncharacterized protein LOC110722707 [Chenopodium quinoa]
MARPMVDVFSVTVYPNSWPCEVYGDVFVFENNDPNTTHQLYKRSLEHAEVIYEAGQGLLLTGLDIVLSIRKPVISILLKDRAHDNDVVAKGNVLLDSTTDNDYEQGKCSVVEGDCGHVRVNYIALACALVAEVHVGLWDFPKQTATQEDSKNSILASGTIVAHHAKTYARTTWDTWSTLLKVPSNQSIPVVFDANDEPIINLTRKLLAVPAYASLIIEANTIEEVTNKQFFVGTAEFRAAQGRTHSSAYYNCDELQLRFISYENVFLSVRWREPFDLQYQYSPKEYLTPQPCFLSQVCEPGDCLLEVFSVFLGRKNDEDLSISGTITVSYGTRSLTIFERDDNNPDRLVNGSKLLSISSPGFVDSHADFEIRVNLKVS